MNRILATFSALVLVSSCSGRSELAAPAENDATPAITLTLPENPLNAVGPPGPEVEVDREALDHVRELTERFYRGEMEQLHGTFSDGLKEVLSLDQMHQLHRHVAETYGKETQIIAEETKTSNDYRGFVRWARFDKTEDVIEVRWTLKPDDSIAEFWIRPARRTVKAEAN